MNNKKSCHFYMWFGGILLGIINAGFILPKNATVGMILALIAGAMIGIGGRNLREIYKNSKNNS
ncbi:hypothetical protein PV797_17840 [Clostridiaceae bacterium M8S5]|nr:hypothetical protein PV797_17840 [Clostridiaceae bacterium M8S5]